jgi:hypothetical protein
MDFRASGVLHTTLRRFSRYCRKISITLRTPHLSVTAWFRQLTKWTTRTSGDILRRRMDNALTSRAVTVGHLTLTGPAIAAILVVPFLGLRMFGPAMSVYYVLAASHRSEITPQAPSHLVRSLTSHAGAPAQSSLSFPSQR